RLEEAEADREALRAALAATESALRRARGDARELRQRLEATSVPAPAGADPVAPPAPMPEAVSAGAPDEPATRGTGWLRRRRAPALTG
ncbi:MAG: hypothetical protein MUE51_12015, partial [Thermoleophilia bacterium]|nr:hypothetical protein [Thermoleophilia bacterium]